MIRGREGIPRQRLGEALAPSLPRRPILPRTSSLAGQWRLRAAWTFRVAAGVWGGTPPARQRLRPAGTAKSTWRCIVSCLRGSPQNFLRPRPGEAAGIPVLGPLLRPGHPSSSMSRSQIRATSQPWRRAPWPVPCGSEPASAWAVRAWPRRPCGARHADSRPGSSPPTAASGGPPDAA